MGVKRGWSLPAPLGDGRVSGQLTSDAVAVGEHVA